MLRFTLIGLGMAMMASNAGAQDAAVTAMGAATR